jgi:hypothetical protein
MIPRTTKVGVTKDILKGVLGGSPELRVRRIDEGGLDGDLCAIVSDADKKAVAVVWPTAEKLPILKQLAQVGVPLGCLGCRHACAVRTRALRPLGAQAQLRRALPPPGLLC